MDQLHSHSPVTAPHLGFTYSERTSDIEVQVRPSYLIKQSRPDQEMYCWSYMVTIKNNGTGRLQLLNRHWIITDGRGRVEEIKGNGVVGEQPIILPGTTYSYTSGCPLRTSTGNMRGWYEYVDIDTRTRIKTKIPVFFLRSDMTNH